MKLVTFVVGTPIGRQTRLGALLDGHEDGRVVDLTAAYGAYLAAETDESKPREIAAVRTPPDLIGWLEGGRQSREAAEQALAYVRRRLAAEAGPEGLDGARLVYERADVRLLAPLPRPRSIRDFTVFEEHMSQARGIGAKLPKWY